MSQSDQNPAIYAAMSGNSVKVSLQPSSLLSPPLSTMSPMPNSPFAPSSKANPRINEKPIELGNRLELLTLTNRKGVEMMKQFLIDNGEQLSQFAAEKRKGEAMARKIQQMQENYIALNGSTRSKTTGKRKRADEVVAPSNATAPPSNDWVYYGANLYGPWDYYMGLKYPHQDYQEVVGSSDGEDVDMKEDEDVGLDDKEDISTNEGDDIGMDDGYWYGENYLYLIPS
ncbi:hypothetical protein P280DRAFT_531178 [Massarina eburnea CBS 473.64]|uniref:Uncharacterized protein n=1 Tax=Massarina eburnea CBS 473.64 TaxID=1395130 RepID=A0A6A6SES4_9PLEO|nr:hypothetical protein P280DRAFT_531178 [Massarina eburnea CBS 473.64]